MEHKATFHIVLPRMRGIRNGAFIEQTFTQITDDENESKEFGEKALRLSLAFMDGMDIDIKTP